MLRQEQETNLIASEARPLVSVGIPTYNRPDGLRRTLACITAQTYSNLEIIVSDNGSSGQETSEVVSDFMERDHRIRYFRQEVNKGAKANFSFLILQATGEYFMWAADDDGWESNYISELVDVLHAEPSLVLAAAEAQYVLHDGARLPFFPEGEHYYHVRGRGKLRRLLEMIWHNYGNMVYGIFRRKVLIVDNTSGSTVLTTSDFVNEIPALLWIVKQGAIKVLPKVLFYKTTSLGTYLQAAREYGFKPVVDGEIAATHTPQSGDDPLLHTIRRYLTDTRGLLLYHLNVIEKHSQDPSILATQPDHEHGGGFSRYVGIDRALFETYLSMDHSRLVPPVKVIIDLTTKRFIRDAPPSHC